MRQVRTREPQATGAGTLSAACYVGRRTIELLDREPCDPGPGEVEVAVGYTGICGTDLHIVHGAMDARVETPAVLGHEMSGVVAALGDRVDQLGRRRSGDGHASRLVRGLPGLPRRPHARLPRR